MASLGASDEDIEKLSTVRLSSSNIAPHKDCVEMTEVRGILLLSHNPSVFPISCTGSRLSMAYVNKMVRSGLMELDCFPLMVNLWYGHTFFYSFNSTHTANCELIVHFFPLTSSTLFRMNQRQESLSQKLQQFSPIKTRHTSLFTSFLRVFQMPRRNSGTALY